MTTHPTPSAEALAVARRINNRIVLRGESGAPNSIELRWAGIIDAHFADLRRERDELFDALCDLHAAVWLQAKVTRAESASLGAARRAAKALIDKCNQALANPAET